MSTVHIANIELDSILLQYYVFYAALLCLKLLCMGILVGFSRIYYKVVFNQEDAKWGSFRLKNDETVERRRRAHLNDLENIPVFLVSSFLFILTGPSPYFTLSLFIIYTLARIGHTIIYCIFKNTVLRIVCYDVGLYTNIFMILRTLYYFM